MGPTLICFVQQRATLYSSEHFCDLQRFDFLSWVQLARVSFLGRRRSNLQTPSELQQDCYLYLSTTTAIWLLYWLQVSFYIHFVKLVTYAVPSARKRCLQGEFISHILWGALQGWKPCSVYLIFCTKQNNCEFAITCTRASCLQTVLSLTVGQSWNGGGSRRVAKTAIFRGICSCASSFVSFWSNMFCILFMLWQVDIHH